MGAVVWDSSDCALTKVKNEQEKRREKNRNFFIMQFWLNDGRSGVMQQNYLFNLKRHTVVLPVFT